MIDIKVMAASVHISKLVKQIDIYEHLKATNSEYYNDHSKNQHSDLIDHLEADCRALAFMRYNPFHES